MSAIPRPLSSTANRVLLASSDRSFRSRAEQSLKQSRWEVQLATGGADVIGKMESSPARIVVLDNKLPDLDPADVIEIVETRFPGVEVLLINSQSGRLETPNDTPDDIASELLKVLKADAPHPPNAIVPTLSSEVLPGVVAECTGMKQLARMVTLVARRDTTVLVTGETGTGKELIAAAIHSLSARAAKPLITVNCAAIPETLLEAELFGHTKGAFTGAVQSRIGKINAAQGGTLFLDGIGEMLPAMQAKLLRFLENGEVQRLGSSDVFRLDVRVVTATNSRLLQKVQRGEFREDLFYRLSVFPLEIPPLRERGNDLKVLASHFARKFGGEATRFDSEAEALLQSHCWPGNVRELKHVVERAIILADGEDLLNSQYVSISASR